MDLSVTNLNGRIMPVNIPPTLGSLNSLCRRSVLAIASLLYAGSVMANVPDPDTPSVPSAAQQSVSPPVAKASTDPLAQFYEVRDPKPLTQEPLEAPPAPPKHSPDSPFTFVSDLTHYPFIEGGFFQDNIATFVTFFGFKRFVPLNFPEDCDLPVPGAFNVDIRDNDPIVTFLDILEDKGFYDVSFYTWDKTVTAIYKGPMKRVSDCIVRRQYEN
jgi:hypothetical protein